MAGKFALKKAKNGEIFFNLHAANGQVILTSETYQEKRSALGGIESVRKNAPDEPIARGRGWLLPRCPTRVPDAALPRRRIVAARHSRAAAQHAQTAPEICPRGRRRDRLRRALRRRPRADVQGDLRRCTGRIGRADPSRADRGTWFVAAPGRLLQVAVRLRDGAADAEAESGSAAVSGASLVDHSEPTEARPS